MDAAREPLGFLGAGEMGGPMVRNLLRAGYRVHAFDPDAERLAAVAAAGATAAEAAAAVVEAGEIVLTSLPSSEAFVRAAEEVLLPRARPGQIFLDLGTVTPPETRRLAARFAERGAALVDAPCSGGPEGARRGNLLIFVGGDPAAVERCRPVLAVLGDPDRTTYCGPSGAGQAVKGVNQLAMGLVAAAYLEAIAFGVREGVDAAVLAAAVGGTGGQGNWRQHFALLAGRVARGEGPEIGVKFRELPYYLRAAAEGGFELPLTAALYPFCDRGERVVTDDHRPAPSFWHELLRPAEPG